MTRITSKEIDCLHCGNNYKIVWEASINTWMDLDLIQKVIDDTYYYKCPQCSKEIHFCTKILINCPEGMFWIANDENLDVKKEILMKYKVIDENGVILRPEFQDSPKVDHSQMASDLQKELENIKKDLLDKSNKKNN